MGERAKKEQAPDEKNLPEECGRLFSEKFTEYYSKSGFKSTQKLAFFLEDKKYTLSKQAIDNYSNTDEKKSDGYVSPTLNNACILSKVLGFSLDEIRDRFVDFDKPVFKMTVSRKLLEYLEAYKTITAFFPVLKNPRCYLEIPVFQEFLSKIMDTGGKKLIEDFAESFAESFEKNYCIRYGNTIVEKASYEEDLRKRHEKVMLWTDFEYGSKIPYDKLSEGQQYKLDSKTRKEFKEILNRCNNDLEKLEEKPKEREEIIKLLLKEESKENSNERDSATKKSLEEKLAECEKELKSLEEKFAGCNNILNVLEKEIEKMEQSMSLMTMDEYEADY